MKIGEMVGEKQPLQCQTPLKIQPSISQRKKSIQQPDHQGALLIGKFSHFVKVSFQHLLPCEETEGERKPSAMVSTICGKGQSCQCQASPRGEYRI